MNATSWFKQNIMNDREWASFIRRNHRKVIMVERKRLNAPMPMSQVLRGLLNESIKTKLAKFNQL